MKYNKIRSMDISDGPGVRVSIFFQGCVFNCKNCFNPETHDFSVGKEFTDDTIFEILRLAHDENIKGLSILGGEPMHPINLPGSTKLAKEFKKMYPEKTIWAWTGYTFEEYLKDKEIIKYLDVVVDGLFVQELHHPKLAWKGSSNQRVIDVKETLKQGKIVLFNNYIH